MQLRKHILLTTTDQHKKPMGNELYGRNLCAVLFFFCLARIFVYLRFPGGNCGLSVCSVRVSDSERERVREHVSKSVSMQRVEQLNSALDPLAFRRGKLAPNRRQRKRQTLFSLSSLATLLFFVHLILVFFSLDVCPNGFNVLKFLRILDLFL